VRLSTGQLLNWPCPGPGSCITLGFGPELSPARHVSATGILRHPARGPPGFLQGLRMPRPISTPDNGAGWTSGRVRHRFRTWVSFYASSTSSRLTTR
jgi:hypothetical protein